MLRTEDEKQLPQDRNHDLKNQVEHLESVLSHTSDKLHVTKIIVSETSKKLRDTETRLAEANAQVKLCGSYRRQVEEMLGAI
jgi:septal ring factor EnvC (AmiA/AmiB activator)